MRNGLYRHFADIENFVVTGKGDRGQSVGTWQTLYASVPMSIDALQGKPLELAKQLVASATHKVGLRYLANIAAITCRINFNGRLFLVGWVDEFDFRQRYLTLTCTEQQSGA